MSSFIYLDDFVYLLRLQATRRDQNTLRSNKLISQRSTAPNGFLLIIHEYEQVRIGFSIIVAFVFKITCHLRLYGKNVA